MYALVLTQTEYVLPANCCSQQSRLSVTTQFMHACMRACPKVVYCASAGLLQRQCLCSSQKSPCSWSCPSWMDPLGRCSQETSCFWAILALPQPHQSMLKESCFRQLQFLGQSWMRQLPRSHTKCKVCHHISQTIGFSVTHLPLLDTLLTSCRAHLNILFAVSSPDAGNYIIHDDTSLTGSNWVPSQDQWVQLLVDLKDLFEKTPDHPIIRLFLEPCGFEMRGNLFPLCLPISLHAGANISGI